MTDSNNMIRVCDSRHVVGYTEKAIKVRVGTTLYGEPITTFYPKSACRIRYKSEGGFEVWVPKWLNRDRRCAVGDFEFPDSLDNGFNPLPF